MTTPTCQCGCGRPTKLIKDNCASRGRVVGQPYRFVRGHGLRMLQAKERNAYRSVRVGANCKLVHVVIAEKAIGKPLPSGAQIHHVDGNPSNNANSNLVICQDQKYHALLHIRQRALLAGGDPNTQRVCYKCKRLVLISDLASGGRRDGNICRPCINEYFRQRNAAKRRPS